MKMIKAGGYDRPAAGVIFINGDYLLLASRSADSTEPHTWGCLGGTIEEGETVEQGVLRELQEEANIAVRPESLIPHDLFEGENGFQYHTFVVLCPQRFVPSLNDEHEGYCWFHRTKLPSDLHPGIQAMLRRNGIDEYFSDSELV